MSLNFTTASELVETKMQRNNALIDLLETESAILKKNILIYYRLAANNAQNIQLIKKINQIEALQTQTYCQARQEQVKDFTDQVNNNSPDIKTLCDDITVLRRNCENYMMSIAELNSKIPDQTIVTNYRMPIKLDNCREAKKNI